MRDEAVVRLQRAARVYLLRSRLHTLCFKIQEERSRKAATLIQAHMRRCLAYARVRKLRVVQGLLRVREEAARCIQRLFHSSQLKQRARHLAFLSLLLKLRHIASIEIQRVVKGFFVRKDLSFIKHLHRTVRWSYDGTEVSMVGTITRYPWQEQVKMKYSKVLQEFYSVLDYALPPGIYYVKFIVEGQWTCDGKLPIEQDSEGNYNNVVEVTSRPMRLAGSYDRLAPFDESARNRPNALLSTTKSKSSGSLETEGGGLVQPRMSPREVRLVMSSFMAAHPTHPSAQLVAKGSADVCLVDTSLQLFAIADGVGEWRRHGLDPILFPNELIRRCHSLLRKSSLLSRGGDVGGLLKETLSIAFNETEALGSSTVLLVACVQSQLHSVLLGNSSLLVLRRHASAGQFTRAYRSKEQLHYFNSPYELTRLPAPNKYAAMKSEGLSHFVKFLEEYQSERSSDHPEAAVTSVFPLAPGDVVVAGTDGLFDNLYDSEIADTAETIGRLPLAPDDFCKKLATELTHKAVARAFDRDYFSPFAKAARRARRSYMGGRVDDISVVTAKAV